MDRTEIATNLVKLLAEYKRIVYKDGFVVYNEEFAEAVAQAILLLRTEKGGAADA